MPTSSIIKQIVIDNPKDVKRLIKALEEAEKVAKKTKKPLLETAVKELSGEDLKTLLKTYDIEFTDDEGAVT